MTSDSNFIPETRARQDALVVERIKRFTGSQHLDKFINDHRGAKILKMGGMLMPTSYELLTMPLKEYHLCQELLVRRAYDDAPDDMLSEAVPGPYVYPTEVEFMAMTVEEINAWLDLPCDEEEVDGPELKAAVELANCIRRLRVMGLLDPPQSSIDAMRSRT